ncbi:MAG: signal peptidase I [Clostridia bacterium]|nr:signal peptidase I [Clostridia bacterium]
MRSEPYENVALTNEHQKSDWLTELLDWLKYILIAVLIGLLLVVFVIQRNSVIGYSMLPTLNHNDQLLVEKVTKWFGGIGYADIITIRSSDLPQHENGPNIIKRVIGLPGDTIEICEDGVHRNGSLLEEPYLAPGTVTRSRSLMYEKVKLGENEYYVMGDNREISLDSRSFGPVPFDSIIGEVLLRFYPLDRFGIP